ncbi:MAG TPA: hypothetical protein VKE70_16870 [Candidatus Solibacter sp.]|nr:hypothetical protein [Candidatus Solibacter sp.]
MSKTKASEAGKTKKEKQAKPRLPRRQSAVEKAIKKFEEGLDKKDITLADYLRLVQLQKEIDEDEPKDIECTWVEQSETKSSEE